MPKKLSYEYGWYMGCDPEFFLKPKNGRYVIGAEKAIPIKGGINVPSLHNAVVKSAVICDGVQAELNPAPATCRAYVGNQISKCFLDLKKHLDKNKSNALPSFVPMTKVTKKELNSLAPESKRFGCSPSCNAWQMPPEVPIEDVDPTEYRIRTAGGHLHIGTIDTYGTKYSFLKNNIETIIKMMDYVVGNTCVLLDRDISQVERRKTYGRAGEYRVQPWGLEYRTLSNFWLRSYQLMSLVIGLARQAVIMTNQAHADNIFKLIDTSDIIKAINYNDFDLAMHNFVPIAEYIAKICPTDDSNFPLTAKTIPDFLYLVGKGIDTVFTKDVMKHWTELSDGHGIGWEEFCKCEIRPERTGLGKKHIIYQ